MDEPARKYADTFVMKVFSENRKNTLAAEDVVALNLWMHIAHVLYVVGSMCKASTNSSSSEIFLSTGDLAKKIDVATAYWIGDSLQIGNFKDGHLLYVLIKKTDKPQVGVSMMKKELLILLYSGQAEVDI